MRCATHSSSSSGKSLKTPIWPRSAAKRSAWLFTVASLISHRAQILMYELHCVRAFTDAASYALHRSKANIPGYKNARHARLQQPRIPLQRPTLRRLPITHQVRPAQEKSFFFALQHSRQPVCTGHGTNKDEQRIRRDFSGFAARSAMDGNRFEMLLTKYFDH